MAPGDIRVLTSRTCAYVTAYGSRDLAAMTRVRALGDFPGFPGGPSSLAMENLSQLWSAGDVTVEQGHGE